MVEFLDSVNPQKKSMSTAGKFYTFCDWCHTFMFNDTCYIVNFQKKKPKQSFKMHAAFNSIFIHELILLCPIYSGIYLLDFMHAKLVDSLIPDSKVLSLESFNSLSHF